MKFGKLEFWQHVIDFISTGAHRSADLTTVSTMMIFEWATQVDEIQKFGILANNSFPTMHQADYVYEFFRKNSFFLHSTGAHRFATLNGRINNDDLRMRISAGG